MADEGEVSIQMDALARAVQAAASASISPQSLLLAWTDWASHLASSPGKQSELMSLAAEQASALAGYLRECLLAGTGDRTISQMA